MPDSIQNIETRLGEGVHHGVPMDFYHGDCCPGASVSGSVLWALHEGCPAKALASHYLSPWPREDDSTPAKAFGIAAHTLILEGPAVFAERYVVKPDDFNGRSREGKEWMAENAAKEAITADQFKTLAAMRRAVEEHPTARNAFLSGAPEVSLITKDEETGIWLKARPDYLRDHLAVNYKTDRNAAPGMFQRTAWNLGYHISAALTVDVLTKLDRPAHYAFIVQEKEPPYLIAVRVLSDDFLEGGRMIYRRALRTFADCLASGKWEGYGDAPQTTALPAWADKFLANMESPL